MRGARELACGLASAALPKQHEWSVARARTPDDVAGMAHFLLCGACQELTNECLRGWRAYLTDEEKRPDGDRAPLSDVQ
jgi:hypothetical protein